MESLCLSEYMVSWNIGDYLGFSPSVLLLFKHQATVLIGITFKNERAGKIVRKLLDDEWASQRGEAKPVCIYVIPFSRKEVDYAVITKIEVIVLWGYWH